MLDRHGRRGLPLGNSDLDSGHAGMNNHSYIILVDSETKR